MDTDGDCRKMIPIFLETGTDALMPFEVQAGMDVARVNCSHGTPEELELLVDAVRNVENRLERRAMVSITDHDNIEAPML